jgi:putative oxidoreductase
MASSGQTGPEGRTAQARQARAEAASLPRGGVGLGIVEREAPRPHFRHEAGLRPEPERHLMSHASAPHENAPLASAGGFDADLAFIERWAGPLGLLARAMLGYVFFVEGVGKVVNYNAVVGYMQSHGVDGRLLPLAILTEVCGSLLVLVGFKTRWAAVALSGFCVFAALLFHVGGGYDETLQLQKDIAIGGGFLALALFGPGPWSIDAWRRRGGGRPVGE